MPGDAFSRIPNFINSILFIRLFIISTHIFQPKYFEVETLNYMKCFFLIICIPWTIRRDEIFRWIILCYSICTLQTTSWKSLTQNYKILFSTQIIWYAFLMHFMIQSTEFLKNLWMQTKFTIFNTNLIHKGLTKMS